MTSSDTEEYDDLSDLDTMEMDSVREWEMQFKGNLLKLLPIENELTFTKSFVFTEKYEYVGRLLRPGEEPTSYSDEEDETPIESSNNSSKSSNKDDIKDFNSTSEEKPKAEWPKQRKPTTESKNSSNSHSTNNTIANNNIHSNNNIYWNLWHNQII